MDDFENMARSLLGYYGYQGGLQPGGFVSALINAWEKADYFNRLKLRGAFPQLGDAIQIFTDHDGPGRLQRLVGVKQDEGVKNDA